MLGQLHGGGLSKWISTAKSDINVAIAVWNDWASYFKIKDEKLAFD